MVDPTAQVVNQQQMQRAGSNGTGGGSGSNGTNNGGQNLNENSSNNENDNVGNNGDNSNNTAGLGGTRTQFDEIDSAREALYSPDGWGCQQINHDKSWDVPGSPERGGNDGDTTGSSVLKPPINNGTDLWEINVRKGGKGGASSVVTGQVIQKNSCNHTPTTNLGGTWGEDCGCAVGGGAGSNSGNTTNPDLWNNPHLPSIPAAPVQWGPPAGKAWPDAATAAGVIPPKKELEWTNTVAGNNAYGDARAVTRTARDMRMISPTDQLLNVDTPPDICYTMTPGQKPSGWGDLSPPTQRRISSKFDDGTSIWGQQQPQQQQLREPPVLPAFGNMPNASPISPAPMGLNSAPIKADGNVWGIGGQPRNNTVWGPGIDDKPIGNSGIGGNIGGDFTGAWDKNQNKVNSGAGMWQESNLMPPNKQPQQKVAGVGGLNSDIIRSSKQIRILLEMGFKEDESEMALNATNLNIGEAINILNSRNKPAMDLWRRQNESQSQFPHPGRFASQTGGGSGSMPFPPSNNNRNALKNMNVGGNPMNNMQQSGSNFPQNAPRKPSAQQLQMLVQQIQMAVQSGYLSSQILNQPLAPTTLVLINQLLNYIELLQGVQTNLATYPMNSIQLSTTAAKYKQQIANLQGQINAQQALYIRQQRQRQQQQQQQQQQPAPVTGLTGPNQQQNDYYRGSRQQDPTNISVLQRSLSELSLNKDQMNVVGMGGNGGGGGGAGNGGGGGGMTGMQQQSMSAGLTPSITNQQSRLNQWRFTGFDKDMTSDFGLKGNLPPGQQHQQQQQQQQQQHQQQQMPGATALNTNNIINTNSLQNDGTWSSKNESKAWPAAFTDLVPEFEPGKPWKGFQMDNDMNSPLNTDSITKNSLLFNNSTPKDTTTSNKTSPTDLPPLSLSSSTWSFNPSDVVKQSFTSNWSDSIPQVSSATPVSDLWAAPNNKSSLNSCDPPPGFGSTKSMGGGLDLLNSSSVPNTPTSSLTTGLIGNITSWPSTQSSSAGGGGGVVGSGAGGGTNWLLLKNLTTQFDGSTLRSLCMQHGHLLRFHSYLNQGIALCKFSTCDEAIKAQIALNNFVLGNTAISAELPNESDVQTMLQHLQGTTALSGLGQSQISSSIAGLGGGGGNGNNTGSGLPTENISAFGNNVSSPWF